MTERLDRLEAGMAIPYGGDRVVRVPPTLADAFRSGDRLVVVQDTGDLLHIPANVWDITTEAVDRAASAFSEMGEVSESQMTAFYRRFAAALAADASFAPIGAANAADVADARRRGRSTTRLELTPRMRADMISGLETWESFSTPEGADTSVEHDGWRVELHRAGLGVVGFVFEGRPNVFADASGVLRSGNSVVFRIGSDALGTARAIMTHAVGPALAEAGLPAGAISLVDTSSRAGGWAMFSDRRLGLAVARGSGPAVAQLGAVARQAGIPVSLHGTGGAWMVVSDKADAKSVELAVYHSLDRKVCNTLNTVAVVSKNGAANLDPVLNGLRRAAERRQTNPKLHVVGSVVLPEYWQESAAISRAEGESTEPRSEPIGREDTGLEWEWEESPEVTLMLVDSIDEAVRAFNEYSPRFVASLISPDGAEHETFYNRIDAPFVGNGFTRWVDGQYALDRPELGLSNWQFGRLLGRGGVLSGDSIYTIRTRAVQENPDIGR